MTHGAQVSLLRGLDPTSVTLTPIALPEGLLVVRSPRLSDGPAWSAARLANREWLERAFPAWGDDWPAEQSEVTWAQRWARLRALAATGRALPFVLTLDGELIGELGIVAVDDLTGTGEVSVWAVRSHGSPGVLRAAMLMLVEHAFTAPRPLRRVLSPVATSSRRGRTPGLTSVGFAIEATVPRKVGAKGLVDHDMWMVHNTAEVRRSTTEALRPMRAAPTEGGPAGPQRSTGPVRTAVVLPAGRAAVREARGRARQAREWVVVQRADRGAEPRQVALDGAGRVAVLRRPTRHDPDLADGRVPRGATSWCVETGGRVHAVVAHRDDVGTGTTELFVATRPGADREAVTAATAALLEDLRPRADEPRLLVVRVPAGAPPATTLDRDQLTGLGLEHLARYPDRDDDDDQGTTHEWGGEDVWRVPPTS